MWKIVRVSLLLIVLAYVGSSAWFEQHRAHEWHEPQDIGIVPVIGDDSAATLAYVAQLEPREFSALESFMAEQAASYGLSLRDPVRVHLYAPIRSLPPAPPAPGHPLAAVWWSLKLRYYAARFGEVPPRAATAVRMFVVYHDPARAPRLAHSAGLEKGLIAVAHLFAIGRMSGSNSVVVAHEYLHTLGATDKYDPATDAPLYPAGFAEPAQDPRYPQRYAEIMAGRRPLTPTSQEMPESLGQCVIGEATAAEIRWLSH
jgi:hypothetical protein